MQHHSSFPKPVMLARCCGGGMIARAATMAMIICATAFMAAAARTSPPMNNNAPSATVDRFAAFIDEAAQRFGVPALWLRFVMQAESAGDANAVSPKGAMGLMQIMPETYARLRQAYGWGADPFQPRDNILAGAAYLREMYDRYGAPGFLAAYNAGPGRYEDHLATGRSLPEETQLYLARLAPLVADVQAGSTAISSDPLAWTRAPLFITRAITGGESDAASDGDDAFPAADLLPERPPTEPAADVAGLAPQPNGLFVQLASGAMPQ